MGRLIWAFVVYILFKSSFCMLYIIMCKINGCYLIFCTLRCPNAWSKYRNVFSLVQYEDSVKKKKGREKNPYAMCRQRMPKAACTFAEFDHYYPYPAEPGYTLPLQTVQIQISWLLKKPTDLDLYCLPLSM